MAGDSVRFKKAGYKNPKPFIEIAGKPMIKWVVDNIGIDGKYIFIVQKTHLQQYPHIEHELLKVAKNVEILTVDGRTEGATCTVLIAKESIDNNEPLLICNSDQWVDWDSKHFISFIERKNSDGALLSFFSDSPKHSYAGYDYHTHLVTETAEKQVISNFAAVGIYYWKTGACFVECANTMIEKNIRTNNEFYLCPVFNELILNKGGKVHLYPVSEMRSMGNPEELDRFLKLLEEDAAYSNL